MNLADAISASPFVTRLSIIDHCVARHAALDGMYLEFGVFEGDSLRRIAAAMRRYGKPGPAYGFDSFEGIPENWGTQLGAGYFACDVPQFNDAKISIVKGLFQDTLAPFLASHPGPAAFVHIDCDLYSSAKCVLDALDDRIVTGTVIVFDEMIGYPEFAEHEFKAFSEYIERTGKRYRVLCRGELQVAVQITSTAANRIIVGTFTGQRFAQRRALCRATWWNDAERFPEVERFWVAGAEGKVSQPWRIDEWLFLPVLDSYESLIWRTQELCRWAMEQGDFDYLVKCDDDTLILWDRFLPLVREHLAAGHDYVGNDFHPPDESRSFSGGCYLLSHRAAKIVAETLHNNHAGGEDGSVGLAMIAAGVPASRDERIGLPTPWPQNRWIPTPDNSMATLNALAPYDELWRRVWRECGKLA